MRSLANAIWLAKAYLLYKKKNVSIRFVLRLCITGIMLGTASLLLSLMITRGFEDAISKKIRGINASYIITAPGNNIDEKGIITAFTNWFGNDVSVSPSSTKQVIINHNGSSSVIYLRGIIAAHEAATTSLASKIIMPPIQSPDKASQHLEAVLGKEQIIVGSKLARSLGLSLGDELELLIPSPDGKKKLKLKSHTVTLSAIITIGLEEYDAHAAFIDLVHLQKIFDERGVQQLAITINNGKNTKTILQTIRANAPDLVITPWQELYPALVESLALEKYALFIILALITLVACMNMISLLFMQIQEKRRDIALLLTLGAPHSMIRLLFIILGMLVTALGCLLGVITAWCGGIMLERMHIQLPDVYYLNYLPIYRETGSFLLVFLITLLLGFLASLVSTQKLRSFNLLEILKH